MRSLWAAAWVAHIDPMLIPRTAMRGRSISGWPSSQSIAAAVAIGKSAGLSGPEARPTGRIAVVAICIGVGQGLAIVLER
jgi:hypothetical protein